MSNGNLDNEKKVLLPKTGCALDSLVRRSVSFALRHSSKSRQAIAEEMSRLTETGVSIAMLDAYTAESKRAHRFPASWLPALSVATNDTYTLRRLAEAAGVHLVSDEDMEWIELGKQCYARDRALGIIDDLLRRIDRRKGDTR